MMSASLLVGLAACGRIDFNPLVDANADAPDAVTACSPWTNVRPQTATSGGSDFGPTLSADTLTLYFDSGRAGGVGNADIWTATRASTSADFGPAVNLSTVNTTDFDRSPTLTADGLTLYFQRGETPGRLYRAVRAQPSDPFGPPQLVAELAAQELAGPGISPDGTELVFTASSNLFRAAGDGTTFGNVTQITELDTTPYQGFASLSSDGLDIYFETTRSDGALDDIWRGHRAAIGATYDLIERVDEVSESGTSDDDPAISVDGETLAFASNRSGSFEIWLASRSCQ
ncbi:MAG TPA: hypothetical protein VGM90_24165 [Kofleriaceae bacterium]|jgi:Tol biopolymer transport system component